MNSDSTDAARARAGWVASVSGGGATESVASGLMTDATGNANALAAPMRGINRFSAAQARVEQNFGGAGAE
jgi:hypothetical protein